MGGRGASTKLGKVPGGGDGGSVGGLPGGAGGGSSPHGISFAGGAGSPFSGAPGSGFGSGSAGGGPMSGYPGAGAGGAGIPGSGTASLHIAPDTTFGQDPNHQGYLTFTTNQEAYQWHEQNNFDRAKWNAIAPEERQGVYDYTDFYYSTINTTLRHDSRPDINTQSQIDGAKAGLAKFENAADVIVFRGANAHWTANLLKSDEKLSPDELSNMDHHAVLMDANFLRSCIGKTVRDRGFMSSAVTEDDAWGSDVIYKIYVPRGTHGLYVDPISAHGGEREYLFNSGQYFIVHSITTDSAGEVSELVLEAIP